MGAYYPDNIRRQEDDMTETLTAFTGHSRLITGSPADVALALKRVITDAPVLVFSDVTGRETDLDVSGSDDDIRARYGAADEPRGRGRPKLGVTAREVTLLPRHWDWLNDQPGGASAALRRLIDAARKSPEAEARTRRDVTYRFLAAIAGDYPGFENAARALYAGDRAGFEARLAPWPADVADHALKLAYG